MPNKYLVKGSKNESRSEGARGVERGASEGARRERGCGDGELQTTSVKESRIDGDLSYPNSKGANRLEILVESHGINDKNDEERGQELPNKSHAGFRVGQGANGNECGGGGRQAQPQKSGSNDRTNDLSTNKCESIGVADAMGGSECSSDGGVDMASTDVGDGIKNNGECEAVSNSSRSQTMLSSV